MLGFHTRVSDYADELIAVPRAHLRLEVRQQEGGVMLSHDGRPLVECSLTREGMTAAGFLCQALGVKLPPLGDSTPARVSTGVLYRALAIARLDYDKEESYLVLERLLEEAHVQRGAPSEAV